MYAICLPHTLSILVMVSSHSLNSELCLTFFYNVFKPSLSLTVMSLFMLNLFQ